MDKKEGIPEWFYYGSIMAAFLFSLYISIYAAIHFESISYMNIMVVFFFLAITMFFIISAVYFRTEKMNSHIIAPLIFLAGIIALIAYAYGAVDASGIVQYSIIYTIAIMGYSLFVLIGKKKGNPINVSGREQNETSDPQTASINALFEEPVKAVSASKISNRPKKRKRKSK
jgi:hypothetical protein